MKMMMISSLVEIGGWGTPPIPGGGNKDTGVVKVEGDPVASTMVGEGVTPMRESIRVAGFAFFPSHSTRSEIDQPTISEIYVLASVPREKGNLVLGLGWFSFAQLLICHQNKLKEGPEHKLYLTWC